MPPSAIGYCGGSVSATGEDPYGFSLTSQPHANRVSVVDLQSDLERERARVARLGEALLPADVEIATLKIARDAAIRSAALGVRRIDGRRAMNIKQSGSTTEFYGCCQNPAVSPLLSRNVKKPWA